MARAHSGKDPRGKDPRGEDPRGEDPRAARVVKRYANRKLYDTRQSRYVTLQQVAQLVRRGEDVRIIDNESKVDLTDVTLAQIIYEEQKDKGGGRARSLGTLRALIQRGGERLFTTLRDGPVGKLVRTEEELGGAPEAGSEGVRAGGARAEHPSRRAGGGPQAEGAVVSRDPRRSVVAQSRDALDELSRMADDRMRALVGRAAHQAQQLHAEILRLQERVAELEDRLRRASRPKGSDRPSGKP